MVPGAPVSRGSHPCVSLSKFFQTRLLGLTSQLPVSRPLVMGLPKNLLHSTLLLYGEETGVLVGCVLRVPHPHWVNLGSDPNLELLWVLMSGVVSLSLRFTGRVGRVLRGKLGLVDTLHSV